MGFQKISDQDFGKLLKHALEGSGCSACSSIISSILDGNFKDTESKIRQLLSNQDSRHSVVRITLIHILNSKELTNAK